MSRIGPDRHLGGLEEGDVLGLRAPGDEPADDGVELGAVAHALGVGAEARVVDQLRSADGAEQPLAIFCVEADSATQRAVLGRDTTLRGAVLVERCRCAAGPRR